MSVMTVEDPQTVRGYSPQTLLTLGRVGTSSTLRSLTRNVVRLSLEASQRLRFDGRSLMSEV